MIQVNNVVKTFDGFRALDGLTMTVEEGSIYGLVGPNGAGKSTILRHLSGAYRQDSGEILLDGLSLSRYRFPCPVQLIGQHPETMLDPLLPLGRSLEEAGPADPRLLEGLHIQPGWLTRYPQELSGGELQRFCIARALGPRTRYLLCDEITAMLDLITQAQIWDFLLREAETRNLGLLIVSHSAPLLERLCTRRLVLTPEGGVRTFS